MPNSKIINGFKIIPILVFIFSYFVTTFIYMFIRDVSVLFSLLNDYATSGNSFFIPTLPYLNVLWFLPEKYQTIQLSLGHLIDIIIIFNLFCYVDTGFYHYFKKAFLNGEDQIFFYIDLSVLGSKGNIYGSSQDPDIIFRLKEESIYYSDDKLFGINIERNCRLNERNDNFYNHLRRKRYGYNIIQNRIFQIKYNFTSYNRYSNLRVSCNHSVFERFWIYHSKNYYPYPKINNFTDSNEHINGEGGQK
ncbi:MAG: hypothetical protein ACFFDO_02525 [Candidatus Thorarchaeota archaeon]